MVQSILNADVEYPIRRDLEPEDKDFDAWVYEIPIDGKDTTVAVGSPRLDFEDQGIIYYPIYRVDDGAVVEQIGVYEADPDSLPNILDEDGAIQPELMGSPILYPVAKPSVLDSVVVAQEPEQGQEQEQESGSGSDEDDMETREDDEEIRKKYKAKRSDKWIQRFMKNPRYGIVDNEAGGDCLFAAIRQGLESVSQIVSVADMRGMLAEEVNQALFEGYEAQYSAAKAQYDGSAMAVKMLREESNRLRERMKGASRSVQMSLVGEAEGVTSNLKEEKAELAAAKEFMEEFEFMKGITTLDALKAVIQTSKYWGDTWAISTLERVLKIKLVIFSHDAFRVGDEGNVLLCGQNNDDLLEKEGEFKPDFYLLLSLGGTKADAMHYELITYNEKRAFTYKQLPYKVRHLILTKCLEKQAGPYALIPDFRDATVDVIPDEAPRPVSPRSRRTAVFQIYGKSAGKPRPGEGAGEEKGSGDVGEFSKLAAIPDWRRLIADDGLILSKDGSKGITIDGKRWATVTHYGLGARYSKQNPEFSETFVYTEGKGQGQGQGQGQGPGADVVSAIRIARGKPRKGEPNPPLPDPGADQQQIQAMHKARGVKFGDETPARSALVATRNADIRVFRRGAPAKSATELIALRKTLTDKKEALSNVT